MPQFAVYFSKQDTILMLFIYPKKGQDDLTKEQLKILKSIVTKEFK